MRATQKELLLNLEKQGLRFSQFSFEQEGDFLPTDADWNYKDVPHLNIVHELVDATYAMVGDEMIATINMQKILGLRFPLTVFNYQSTAERQTYFASFFVFQLIIETSYQKIAPLRTRVVTNYAIGSAPFWQIFVPILKWILRKNFDNLMSTDLPMRQRRGQLRKLGYTFKGDNQPYSFRATMNIAEDNLQIPKQTAQVPVSKLTTKVTTEELRSKRSILIGEADHRGLRLQMTDFDQVEIFPRTCPHEGASLDHAPCSRGDKAKSGQISCPWHGRIFRPLAQLSLADTKQTLDTDFYQIRIAQDAIEFQMKPCRSATGWLSS